MDLNKIYAFILSQCSNPNDSKVLLKDLLSLYNFIYSKAGSVAVQYGNGTHPKHRLTKYHEFFVNNVGKNESVLDLGSGRGDVTYDISKKTSEKVVGIEINTSNLSYATKTYVRPNLSFIGGDIYRDIPKKHFDIVILSNVLEHLDDRINLLKTISDKTTPCKILLRVPCFEREWTVAMKKELELDYFLDSTHKIEYTHEEFYREMADGGLDIISTIFKWGEIWAICKPK
jgi:SAM-dependent methyltransferase